MTALSSLQDVRVRGFRSLVLAAAVLVGGAACSETNGNPPGVGGSGGAAGRGGAPGGGSGGSAGSGGSGGPGGASGAAGSAAGGAGGTGSDQDSGTQPPPPLPASRFAYVGSANAIYVFSIDAESGALTQLGAPVAANPNPSFLAIAPDGRHLFAVNEEDNVDDANAGAVSSFGIDAATGALSFINRVSSQGAGPAHVSVDRSGRFVLVANYNGGTAAVLPVASNGTLSAAVDTESFGGGAQSHQALVDPSNGSVFVVNKGLSNIAQYAFNATTGALTPRTPAAVALAGGAGTRHLAFHPSAPFAYAINELDDTVVTLGFNASQGTLTALQTLSSLPEGVNGNGNTGAEIVVAPSGRFVYASNRGHDSVVLYSVDASAGTLTLVGHQATGGDTPRSFCVEPSGRRMLVANQGSNEVVTFAVDTDTGLLSEGPSVTVPSPAFVGVYPPGG